MVCQLMCEGYPYLSVELREEESTYLFTEPEKSDCVFSTGKTACTVKVARPKTTHNTYHHNIHNNSGHGREYKS